MASASDSHRGDLVHQQISGVTSNTFGVGAVQSFVSRARSLAGFDQPDRNGCFVAPPSTPFTENKTVNPLIRSLSAARLLHRFGHIFKESTGTEETYQLSQPSKVIDVFVSHAWISSWHEKFRCLALYFNFHFALWVQGVVVALLVLLFHWYPEDFPLSFPMSEEWAPSMQFNLLTMPVCLLAFVLALLFGSTCSSQRVFLDKACVRQCGDHPSAFEESCHACNLKKRGIAHLGDFLHRSRRMVILLGHNYVNRLWCMYELAFYLKHAGVDRIDVVQLDMDAMFIVLVVIVGFSEQAHTLRKLIGEGHLEAPAGVMSLLEFSLHWLFLWVFRRNRREHKELVKVLEDWNFSESECAVSSDRAFVRNSIREWYKEHARPMDHFEMIVRSDIYGIITTRFDPSVICYKPSKAIAMFLPSLWLTASVTIVDDLVGTSSLLVFKGVAWIIILGPAFLCVVTQVTRATRCFHFLFQDIIGAAMTMTFMQWAQGFHKKIFLMVWPGQGRPLEEHLPIYVTSILMSAVPFIIYGNYKRKKKYEDLVRRRDNLQQEQVRRAARRVPMEFAIEMSARGTPPEPVRFHGVGAIHFESVNSVTV